MATANGSIQQIDVDELAKEKVQEIEHLMSSAADIPLPDASFNSWLSILKQIITAADLHRTNDKCDKSQDDTKTKREIDESIYADYSDDHEQFNAIDLTEQFASNSVKWTIRVRAFKLVHRIIQMVISHNQSLTRLTASTRSPILRHLPDLIRLSFVAATSPYDDLKLQGFEMLKILITVFAKTEEKDFPGYSILDQYKTQVLSALKPAFNIDAPPYITAIASQVCCLWICNGLEKERSSLKRVFHLMLTTIDKLENQNVNQNSKLYTESELEQERLDILGSWAQLYITASEQEESTTKRVSGTNLGKFDTKYLSELVDPHIHSIVDKWWAALKDYALLIMPSPKVIGTAHGNEHVYTKDVALRLFAPIWGKLILASSIWLCSINSNATCSDNINNNNSVTSSNPVDTFTKANSNCDSSYIQQTKVDQGKHFRFICGILMKEFYRIYNIEVQDSSQDATIYSLRSLMILVEIDEVKTVLVNDIGIAQELYTILYKLLSNSTIARKRCSLTLKSLLKLIFQLVVTSFLKVPPIIQYSSAFLVDLMKFDLENLNEATIDSKTKEIDLHSSNLSIRACNIMIILKLAPDLVIDHQDLSSSLLKVLCTMLLFEVNHLIGLELLDHLRDLYRDLKQDHRKFFIIGLHVAKLSVINSLLNTGNQESRDEERSISTVRLEAYTKSYMQDIDISDAELRNELISSYMNSLVKVISSCFESSDREKSLSLRSKDTLVLAIKQFQELNKCYPIEYKDLCKPEISKLLESANLELSEYKKRLDRAKLDAEVPKKIPTGRLAKTKIVLKADFSNFYAKKS